MIKTNPDFEIVPPKNQIKLFGFDHYFNTFISLYQKNKV